MLTPGAQNHWENRGSNGCFPSIHPDTLHNALSHHIILFDGFSLIVQQDGISNPQHVIYLVYLEIDLSRRGFAPRQ